MAMTYDAARRVSVLVLGSSASTISSGFASPMETWELDASGWTRRATGGFPIRFSTAIAQTGDGGVLLYGGENGRNSMNDTWLWDGTMWSSVPGTAPSAPAQ